MLIFEAYINTTKNFSFGTPVVKEFNNVLFYCRYKQKFGFPFVICARENKVETILKGLQTRKNNIKEDELIIGINEVKKICKLRILNLIDSTA